MESPCINICELDPTAKRCLGRGRSLAEIAAWPSLTDAERRRIVAALEECAVVSCAR